jgi:hypothetical protein
MNPSSVIIFQIDVDGIALDVIDVKQCLTMLPTAPVARMNGSAIRDRCINSHTFRGFASLHPG